MKILVTGAAGFIGSFVAERFAKDGHVVVGIDNLSDYYDISLKRARLERIGTYRNLSFQLIDITDAVLLSKLFAENNFDHVIHLAGQPSVQHSKNDPVTYVNSNILGMLQILENCRLYRVKHLVYASSSSVYGDSVDLSVSENSETDKPLSMYAVTKKTNELMAHSYSHMYQLPTTGLRMFSVYGPWGRPDMAPYIFTKSILEGRKLELFGDGSAERSFTYIEDVVDVISKLHLAYPAVDLSDSPEAASVPFRIVNVGRSTSIRIDELIKIIENEVGVKARIQFHARRTGDANKLSCDSTRLRSLVQDHLDTEIGVGIAKFVRWYRTYFDTEASDIFRGASANTSNCNEDVEHYV